MEIDLPSSHFATDVVVLNINVLRLSMEDWVVGECDGPLVVTFERDGFFFRRIEKLKVGIKETLEGRSPHLSSS